MTSRHALFTTDGFTHASSVIPVVRSSDAESLTVTSALVPSNTRALPYMPEVVQVAPLTVPLFPFPDVSNTVVPAPSLNPYSATRPTACALAEIVSHSKTATVTLRLKPCVTNTPARPKTPANGLHIMFLVNVSFGLLHSF